MNQYKPGMEETLFRIFLRFLKIEGSVESMIQTIITSTEIEEFENMLIADGKSAKTIESYVGDVVGFVAWLESKGYVYWGVIYSNESIKGETI
jgi:hypothetical protein